MEKQQVLRRYALALAMVPDPDAAGDLFMDAPDEAELWVRANRLRAANGLAPLYGRVELPELDASQQEWALHLAERGAYRRRSRRMLMAVGGLVGLAVLLLAGASLRDSQLYVAQLTLLPLGLFLLGAGAWLALRTADRGAWLLVVWGLVFTGGSLLNLWLRFSLPSSGPGRADLQRMLAYSRAWASVQVAATWGTALYVVWRLWPRTPATVRSSAPPQSPASR